MDGYVIKADTPQEVKTAIDALLRVLANQKREKAKETHSILVRAHLNEEAKALDEAADVIEGASIQPKHVPEIDKEDRDELATILQRIADEGLPGPKDLDVAIDAILCTLAK